MMLVCDVGVCNVCDVFCVKDAIEAHLPFMSPQPTGAKPHTVHCNRRD